jgi:hypothetical protein
MYLVIALAILTAAVFATAWYRRRVRSAGEMRARIEATYLLALAPLALFPLYVLGTRQVGEIYPAVLAAVTAISAFIGAAISIYLPFRRAWHARFTALVVCALGVSAVYWAGVLSTPAADLPRRIISAFVACDLTPSLLSHVLSYSARSGFHWFFRNSTYRFPGPPGIEALRYFRTAVPAHVVVLGTALSIAARMHGRVKAA